MTAIEYPNQFAPNRTNAVPCQYKGINFRSLLEARWAYFFDKLGFEWQYEPFELDGYIPDFIVNFKDKDPSRKPDFIVDIKPFFSEDYKKSVCKKIGFSNVLFASALRYTPVAKDSWFSVLVVGDVWERERRGLGYLMFDTFQFDKLSSGVVINTFRHRKDEEDEDYSTGNCSFPVDKLPVDRLDDVFWSELKMIDYDGKPVQTIFMPSSEVFAITLDDLRVFESTIKGYWREAQNATQYKPKTPVKTIVAPGETSLRLG